MEHNIRIVGIDLDGTLLEKDHSISDRNIRALRWCLDHDIMVYLVTGRPYCFTRYLASQIDHRVKVVAANGGIYEIGNHMIHTSISNEKLSDLIDILKDTGMKAFFKGKHDFYTHEPYDQRFLYDHFNHIYPNELKVHSYCELSWNEIRKQAHDIVKILVYHTNEQCLVQARKRIEDTDIVEITDYQRISFDITAKGINKGNIMKRILEEYNLEKDQFMAIGDGNNDIPMFMQAGLRIAMGNANDDVKALCHRITEDVTHDGVAKAIEQEWHIHNL